MKGLSLLTALLLTVSQAHAVTSDNAGSSVENYSFHVYLDDEKIGSHTVELEKNGDTTRVITRANFEYRILFIPVYSYEHKTIETWRGQCIESISSTTDDNGDEFFIQSERDQSAIKISTREGEQLIDQCVRTYAYWDSDLLASTQLLNTQNGKYQDVKLTEVGETLFETGQSSIPTRRFNLATEEGDIALWYSEQGEWLALETRVENGSTIRYVSAAISSSESEES